MSTEGDAVEVEAVEVAADAPRGQLTVEEALQEVLKKALVHDGLARGLRESVKALDRRQATSAFTSRTNTEKEYIKLVEALCAEPTSTKVVGCSCVVVKDFGEDLRLGLFSLNSFQGR
ncbi:hypothetical protein BC829DRAFT_414721 [Chytridium lagenaria]|nr:hypothetical protein BC829DRAFT_414721 [Chytridium lagenaria]